MGLEKLEIALDGSSHRQRTTNAIGNLRATDHVRASLVLCLREIEDDCAVGVAKVVGRANALDDVAPASNIVARNPRPCGRRSSLAAFEPSVADMQARLE